MLINVDLQKTSVCQKRVKVGMIGARARGLLGGKGGNDACRWRQFDAQKKPSVHALGLCDQAFDVLKINYDVTVLFLPTR